jgi:transcriptional regulator with XRE-family HTH domain
VIPDPTGHEPDASEEWRTLGARLKGIREYLNLSQHDVAVATGIPRSAISDIERGNRKVDSLELRKFSRLYRYPVG